MAIVALGATGLATTNNRSIRALSSIISGLLPSRTKSFSIGHIGSTRAVSHSGVRDIIPGETKTKPIGAMLDFRDPDGTVLQSNHINRRYGQSLRAIDRLDAVGQRHRDVVTIGLRVDPQLDWKRRLGGDVEHRQNRALLDDAMFTAMSIHHHDLDDAREVVGFPPNGRSPHLHHE